MFVAGPMDLFATLDYLLKRNISQQHSQNGVCMLVCASVKSACTAAAAVLAGTAAAVPASTGKQKRRMMMVRKKDLPGGWLAVSGWRRLPIVLFLSIFNEKYFVEKESLNELFFPLHLIIKLRQQHRFFDALMIQTKKTEQQPAS